MAISFNNIPANIRVPLFYAELDNSFANQGLVNYRALIVGQKLPSGSAAADVPVLVSGSDQAKSYFGLGSNLARMVAAFRQNEPFTELWCIPLDDHGSAVKADGEFAITGTATAAGTMNFYIGGQRVQIAVAVGDTATEIGDALEAALGANEAAALVAGSEVPVTASNTTGTVTINARNGGEVGNDVDLRMNYRGALGGESLPAGISVAVTAMASGATNPTLTTAHANMGDEIYDFIIQPHTDSTSLDAWGTLMNDTAGRWSYAKQIYGGVFSARSGTVGSLQTFGAGRNDQHMSIIGFYDSPTPAYEVAAMYGARAAQSLSIDPARPLQTLPLEGMLLPPSQSLFTISEQNTLLFNGVATLREAGGKMRISREITTYRVNEFAQADDSYLDVQTLYTAAYVLRAMNTRITSKFGRHKLANDGTRFGDGQAIVTPSVIRGEILALYAEMENQGLVENRSLFEQHLIVERDGSNPSRVNVLFPPDFVNQLRIFAVLNQFRLQYPEVTS